MTNHLFHYLLAFLFLLPLSAISQERDTVFGLDEYLTSVELYHPVALQAGLQNERARAARLMALGGLDPQLTADWNQKEFDDKLYYQIYNAKLRVPTVLGIDVVGGYENTDGVFLNPEANTDRLGLWNVGIEVNVLQGLIVNERRMALDRAEIISNLAENERQIAVNDILFDAAKAYVNWQKYYAYNEVLDTNIELAQTYFVSIRSSYEGGEYTAMDTLEAYILLQDAITLRQKNDVGLIKARQMMENFIWFDGVPLELQEGIVPSRFEDQPSIISLEANLNLIANNPAIQVYRNQQSILEVEQRLKREKLKPKLKLKYNPLLRTTSESVRPTYTVSDFKFGFDFSYPILNRKARADVQFGDIKIRENAFKLVNKQNELNNKLQASVTQIDVLREQLRLTDENTDRYGILLDGERIKFAYGESSVFLLNKRQEKFIDAKLKLIEVRAKIRKEFLHYRHLANDLMTANPG